MKKWFTLMEIVLVLIIIWLISAAIWKMFSFKNTYRFKYDTCYIRTISDIDNFFEKALLQRQVRTWDVYTWVNNYNVIFNTDKQYMALVYSWVWTWKLINYVGSWIDNLNQCYYSPYHTYISWNNMKVVIQWWLSLSQNWNSSKQAMALYTWNNSTPWKIGSTWEILFYRCDSPWTWDCYEKNKIIVDTKTYLIKNYFCKKLNLNTWKCEIWSK